MVTTGGGGGGGGAVTVKLTALLVTPCAEAVIWVEPAATPFASPVFLPSELMLLTVAALVLELAHANVTPVITLLYWSTPTAVNCCVFPA